MLELGLNFAPAPKKLPLLDTIAGVELGAMRLNRDEACDLRGKICGVLRKAKPPRDNLTGEQRKAIKELQGMKDVAILPADKGNATVVMQTDDYHAKLKEMLKSGTYGKIDRDPTSTRETRFTRYLKKLEKLEEISTPLYHRLRPTGSRPPLFYGLPKIHKEGVPMRPIVSCIGSPTYGISKFIASKISPLAGKSDSYVKNSKHFIESIDGIRVEDDEVMISFDVKSLFTNVPIKESLEVIYEMLSNDDSLEERTLLTKERIIEMLRMCLKSTYFCYDGDYYEQKEGAAMGSPVSAIVANLYMEFFEKLAIETSPVKPTLWKRFVDDIFCILKRGKESQLFDHLNGIRGEIQFTMESEKNKKTTFFRLRYYEKHRWKLDDIYSQKKHSYGQIPAL